MWNFSGGLRNRKPHVFHTRKRAKFCYRVRTLEHLRVHQGKLSFKKAHTDILQATSHVVQETTESPTFICLSQTLYIRFRLHYFVVIFGVPAKSQEQQREVRISATRVHCTLTLPRRTTVRKTVPVRLFGTCIIPVLPF